MGKQASNCTPSPPPTPPRRARTPRPPARALSNECVLIQRSNLRALQRARALSDQAIQPGDPAQAGLSPLEVLRLATQGTAAAVGAEDLGTVASGKVADLVLLEANPLENIRNTETIWRVVKGGWIFDPERLQESPSPSSAASGKRSSE